MATTALAANSWWSYSRRLVTTSDEAVREGEMLRLRSFTTGLASNGMGHELSRWGSGYVVMGQVNGPPQIGSGAWMGSWLMHWRVGHRELKNSEEMASLWVHTRLTSTGTFSAQVPCLFTFPLNFHQRRTHYLLRQCCRFLYPSSACTIVILL